jgi:hypothetical protein
MTKKTKTTLMWVGGAALVATVAAVIYEKNKAPAAVPAGQLTPGTPVTAFTPGVKYAFASTIPAGITDSVSLTNALVAAGWAVPQVVYFMGAGTLPAGFQGNTTSYAATGTWSGAANTPVPPGVVAMVST